jgi:hypothetical protein
MAPSLENTRPHSNILAWTLGPAAAVPWSANIWLTPTASSSTTLVPEILGPVAGCVVGVFGAELHGGDVVESAAATTGG